MASKCPKCNERKLESDDDIGFVCYECGTAFSLEEEGWYEEGGNELLITPNPYFAELHKTEPLCKQCNDECDCHMFIGGSGKCCPDCVKPQKSEGEENE